MDGMTLEGMKDRESDILYALWNRMSSGSYFPKPVLCVDIPKKSGGTRPLGIPTVLDRVAQMTARMYLNRFSNHCFILIPMGIDRRSRPIWLWQ